MSNFYTTIHQESTTPLTFARYTAEDQDIVGGIGQKIQTFGSFTTLIKQLYPPLQRLIGYTSLYINCFQLVIITKYINWLR